MPQDILTKRWKLRVLICFTINSANRFNQTDSKQHVGRQKVQIIIVTAVLASSHQLDSVYAFSYILRHQHRKTQHPLQLVQRW